jgi:hypothetical protein
MIKLNSVDVEVIKDHIGEYICLDGKGIMSGLSVVDSKYSASKIIGISTDKFYGTCLDMKRYHAKRGCYLPEMNFNQACAILSKAEYSKLPSYIPGCN